MHILENIHLFLNMSLNHLRVLCRGRRPYRTFLRLYMRVKETLPTHMHNWPNSRPHTVDD